MSPRSPLDLAYTSPTGMAAADVLRGDDQSGETITQP